MRGIWNRTVLYDPQNKIIKKRLHLSNCTKLRHKNTYQCLAVTRCYLPVWTQTITRKCVQNMILTDVYFSYCCSLNHSYIYRQLMCHWIVLSITKRERKQTSSYRKAIFLLYWSSKQAWWYCMGAGFNYTITITSYRPVVGLCTSNALATFDGQSWSSFWCTPI